MPKHKNFKKICIYSEGTAFCTGYVVYFGKNTIYIYNNKDDELLKKINGYKKIFLGKDKKYNSMLVSLTNKKYIYIGRSIITFNTKDKIEKYYSSYHTKLYANPVAIGKDYVYFPDTKEYCLKKEFVGFPRKYSWKEDAHSRLWGINEFKNFKKIKSKKLKVTSNIYYRKGKKKYL